MNSKYEWRILMAVLGMICMAFLSSCTTPVQENNKQVTGALKPQKTEASASTSEAKISSANVQATNKLPEAVLLYSAKKDVPDESLGLLLTNSKTFDVNRPKKYEPSRNSVAAKDWQTYIVDQNGARLEKQPLLVCGKSFYKLVLENRKKHGSWKKTFPWSYDITLLQASQLPQGAKTVLMGNDDLAEAEDIRTGHSTTEGIANLKETAENYSHDQGEEETLETEIGVVSIVGDLVSVQRVKNGSPFGASHPSCERNWETYKVTQNMDGSLALSVLDQSAFSHTMIDHLNEEFDKKVELASDYPDADSRWSNFVLIPSVGGPQVLFGVPAVASEVHCTVIEMLGGKFKETGASNLSTADLKGDGNTIAISPSKQITITREHDQIVCRFQGKSITVMPASAFRGWQWLSSDQLDLFK